MMKVVNYQELAKNLAEAMQSGDSAAIEEASKKFYEAVCEKVKQDAEDFYNSNANAAVMAQRGYRQLTSEEIKFYEAWADGAKSSNPKQAWTDLIDEGGMPETIIEDVYRNLKQNHPLLSKIDFQDVKYLTKWLITKSTADMATWGKVTDEFKKQLKASFETVSVEQAKLSAFVLMPKDLLDLGPTFIDNYVRTILVEAIASGLEYGFVAGSGVDGEPIGLIRDIHKGVTVSTTDGYPEKEAVKVTSFRPSEYGALVARLLEDENGNLKNVSGVQLICNPIDQVTKIMPATTLLNSEGKYVNNVFPVPTEVIPVSRGLEAGQAILAILDEYKGMFGSKKEGTIEYSDENQFIEDIRVYTGKVHAAGRAIDNTTAILLDISDLEPLYITVENRNSAFSPSDDTTIEQTEPSSQTDGNDNQGGNDDPQEHSI